MILLVLLGCVARVLVTSEPPGALITERDGTTVLAPSEVRVRWRPLGGPILCASAPGYRSMQVTGAGLFPPNELRVVLVPLHGPPDAPDAPDADPSPCP